ncbi:hypothetical protein MCEMIE11_00284 [Burkholderiales bacterium]
MTEKVKYRKGGNLQVQYLRFAYGHPMIRSNVRVGELISHVPIRRNHINIPVPSD